jgi:hypothetical protein
LAAEPTFQSAPWLRTAGAAVPERFTDSESGKRGITPVPDCGEGVNQ